MKIFVLTYNTADKPDRRIVAGTYSTYDLAKSAYKRISEKIGGIIVDWEINTTILDK